MLCSPPRDTTYREQSRAFLEKAYKELEEGDLLQASEKGWGAAAQMLKAVAQERGWEHDSHRRLFGVMGRLALEAEGQELRHGFNAANVLHANFYEGRLDSASIEANLHYVRLFIELAEGFLEGADTGE